MLVVTPVAKARLCPDAQRWAMCAMYILWKDFWAQVDDFAPSSPHAKKRVAAWLRSYAERYVVAIKDSSAVKRTMVDEVMNPKAPEDEHFRVWKVIHDSHNDQVWQPIFGAQNNQFVWSFTFFAKNTRVCPLFISSGDLSKMIQDLPDPLAESHFEYLTHFFNIIGRFDGTGYTGHGQSQRFDFMSPYNEVPTYNPCKFKVLHGHQKRAQEKRTTYLRKTAPLSVMVHIIAATLGSALDALDRCACSPSIATWTKAQTSACVDRVVNLLQRYLLMVLQIARPCRGRENTDLTFADLLTVENKHVVYLLEIIVSPEFETRMSGVTQYVEKLFKGKRCCEFEDMHHHRLPACVSLLDPLAATLVVMRAVFLLQPERFSPINNAALNVFTTILGAGRFQKMTSKSQQQSICDAFKQEGLQSSGTYTGRVYFAKEFRYWGLDQDPATSNIVKGWFGHSNSSSQIVKYSCHDVGIQSLSKPVVLYLPFISSDMIGRNSGVGHGMDERVTLGSMFKKRAIAKDVCCKQYYVGVEARARMSDACMLVYESMALVDADRARERRRKECRVMKPAASEATEIFERLVGGCGGMTLYETPQEMCGALKRTIVSHLRLDRTSVRSLFLRIDSSVPGQGDLTAFYEALSSYPFVFDGGDAPAAEVRFVSDIFLYEPEPEAESDKGRGKKRKQPEEKRERGGVEKMNRGVEVGVGVWAILKFGTRYALNFKTNALVMSVAKVVKPVAKKVGVRLIGPILYTRADQKRAFGAVTENLVLGRKQYTFDTMLCTVMHVLPSDYFVHVGKLSAALGEA